MMKKLINTPINYTDDMLRGIYAAHSGLVKYVNNDLRCYCSAKKIPNKVAIITGGGTGHLPLFLGYVGENLLDGCGVGGVFQSPSSEQIYQVAREMETGAGVLFLYGNYTGDIMNFDMATEMLDMDNIATRSIVGADDVLSNKNMEVRRGVAGIFFMYKCAGAKAAQMGTLDEVLAAAQLAKDNTRTVGFALTPCVIPELGHPNFNLGDNEMAFGMGIHGEPGVWNGEIKTARELVQKSLQEILTDMPLSDGEEVCVLLNGLGATSQEELYILAGEVHRNLAENHITVYRTFVGEFATSMEMAGASITLCRVAGEQMKQWIDMPVNTPFYTQAPKQKP